MNNRDLFISWLYNNDCFEFSDDCCVIALEMYDQGRKEEEIKEMLIFGFGFEEF